MVITLEISPALYAQVKLLAERSHLTVEEFLVVAAAEKVAAMHHHEWLQGNGLDDRRDPCNAD